MGRKVVLTSKMTITEVSTGCRFNDWEWVYWRWLPVWLQRNLIVRPLWKRHKRNCRRRLLARQRVYVRREMMWPFKKRPPGEWRYGPRVGRYQRRFWVPLADLAKWDNPQPPKGRGGVHRTT